MTNTPISVLQKAADLGLKLGLKSPATLTVDSSTQWPCQFADTLRDYKPQLLALLQLPFVMVFSEALGETTFFCENEATKAALVEAGASEWSIYTKDELRVLIAQNRTKPFTADELCKLHELKRTFSGRITWKHS
jgi:hypothetical protein